MRSELLLLCGVREIMADRELIAAILTAGMLPTLEIPRSRVGGSPRPLVGGRPRQLTGAEAEDLQRAVDHAFGLYRLVLNGLGVDPFVKEETGPPIESASRRDAET
jgi:hypothetical protein